MPYRRNYRRRSAPKRRYAKKGAKLAPKTALAVRKIVKSQMSKVVESKILDYSVEPIPALCCYHNVPVLLDNNMFYSQQGLTDEEITASRNRVGDSIFVKNIQLSLLLTSFSTRPNLCYRISVVKVASASVTFPSGSIIYGHPQCGNMLLAPIDTELPGLVSVVYDRVFYNLAYQTAQTGNADKKFIWKHNVKVNRKVKYDNASSDPSNMTYRLILTAYDTQAAYITDNVARYTYMRRTHILDS